MIDHKTKLDIIKILEAAPGDRLAAKQIAYRLSMTQPMTSRHLTELVKINHIRECVMNGRKYYYIPTADELAALNTATRAPNWKASKEYKYPPAMQRRLQEIAQHRARHPSIFR